MHRIHSTHGDIRPKNKKEMSDYIGRGFDIREMRPIARVERPLIFSDFYRSGYSTASLSREKSLKNRVILTRGFESKFLRAHVFPLNDNVCVIFGMLIARYVTYYILYYIPPLCNIFIVACGLLLSRSGK